MKNVLLAMAVVSIVVYLFVDVEHEPDLASGVTVLQFWHPWSGEYADALQEVVAEFNQRHDKIHVKALFMPTGAGENMKFFVSVAGGVPPDVIVVDGTQVASWADLGVLRPLDPYLTGEKKVAGVDEPILESDFWGPCWNQCRYNGKTWALGAAADANFSLIWNKHLFREAGLDPEKPPRTLTELEDYCRKLTRYDKDGNIVQLGFLPTYMASAENALMTWGWAFGGEFYDDKTQSFTCNSDEILAAVNWLCDFRDAFGGWTELTAFQAGFGDAAQSPFYVGKLAMQASYIADTQNIAKFAPNLEYGIAPLPGPEDGEIGTSWIGGWTLALPYGDRGNEDAAFKFIHWFTRDPEGTAFISRKMRLLPAYRDSPFFKQDVPNDPVLVAYYNILKNAKHTRPITPANAYYMRRMREAFGDVMRDLKTPEEAMNKAQKDTAEYFAKIQERRKAAHTKSEEN